MYEIPSLVFTGNVHVFSQGSLLRCVSRKGPESGWTRGVVPLPPRDGALPVAVVSAQRSIARCLGVHTQGGKPQGTIERSVLGTRGTIKRSVSGGGGPQGCFMRAYPLVLRTRILSGTRGEARGCWEGAPNWGVGACCGARFFRCQPGREREVRRRGPPFLATARRHAGARGSGDVLLLLEPRL